MARRLPEYSQKLTREDLREDHSGVRCRCHLRLSTPEELANGQCSDCLPTNAYDFAQQRMRHRERPMPCDTGFGGWTPPSEWLKKKDGKSHGKLKFGSVKR